MNPFDIVIIVWLVVLSIAIVCKGPTRQYLDEMIASGATRQSIAERRKHEENFHKRGNINVNFVEKKDRTEATKRYNRTHRLVLDRKLGKHRWVKKTECHRELNLATGKEIWVANA